MVAHNLFGFNFSFFLKGFRLGAWRTTNLSFSGKNLTSIKKHKANISDRVKFIDTIKYFRKNLSVLASSMSNEERLVLNRV